MSNDKTTEQSIPSDAVARIIEAQIGTKEQSDLISSHMDEYFKRFSSYRSKFTDLEWYHIFLDFSDKLHSLPPSPVGEAGKPFNLSEADLKAILDRCLKPEEIKGEPALQHDRVNELIKWFSRGGNPKWFQSHAYELVYYIATNSINRLVDLDAVKMKAYWEGVNIPPTERSFIERHFPEKLTAPSPNPSRAGETKFFCAKMDGKECYSQCYKCTENSRAGEISPVQMERDDYRTAGWDGTVKNP